MNLHKRFRATCVVDWLDLEIRTEYPTPAWRLRKRHGGIFSYATGLDPLTRRKIAETGAQGKNTPTTAFRVRLQDPERFADVKAVLAKVTGIDASVPVSVTGIEVSFDLYALPGTTKEDFLEMTVYLTRHANRISSALPRFYRFIKETHYPTTHREMLAATRDGYCVGFGNKGDDVYQRIYFKRWDNKEPLDEEGYRARHEIRLKGAACPVRELSELGSYKFSTLAKFFKYNEPEPGVPGLMGQVIARRIANGSIVDQKGGLIPAFGNKGRRRKTPMHTVASPLNEVARDQLKKLSRRWQAPAGRGKQSRGLARAATKFRALLAYGEERAPMTTSGGQNGGKALLLSGSRARSTVRL